MQQHFFGAALQIGRPEHGLSRDTGSCTAAGYFRKLQDMKWRKLWKKIEKKDLLQEQ